MGTTTTSDSPQLDISPLDVARIEVVSFDLDGTLLDSRSAWRAGFEAPFARLAQRHPALLTLGDYAHVHDHVFQPFLMAMWERDRGEWTPEYVRGGWRLLLERHATRDDVAADAAFEEYESTWPTLMRLFEESLAVLEAVQARYPMVLLTNGNTTQQRMKIVAHDLERWFQHVVVSEEVGLLKPDPAIFAHAIAGRRRRACLRLAVGVGESRARPRRGRPPPRHRDRVARRVGRAARAALSDRPTRRGVATLSRRRGRIQESELLRELRPVALAGVNASSFWIKAAKH